MRKACQFLFKLTCVLFLLSGSLLVIGQLAGLLVLNGDLIIWSTAIFAKPTFVMSAIAGLLGFVLNYLHPQTVSTEYNTNKTTSKT